MPIDIFGSGGGSGGGGGKILQVVYAADTTATQAIATTTYTDVTGFAATITPTSTSSTILAFFTYTCQVLGGTTASQIQTAVTRNSTTVYVADRSLITGANPATLPNGSGGTTGFSFKDSPASTSALTYQFQAARNFGDQTVYIWGTASDTGVRHIILMEVDGS